MSDRLIKLAQKIMLKYGLGEQDPNTKITSNYGAINTTQQGYSQFAPTSLQWDKNQVLELQKLLNWGTSTWSSNKYKFKLQEDGIYGPQTREILGGVMRGLAITEPEKLVEFLKNKQNSLNNPQQYIDPKKQLVNSIGYAVPNGSEVRKVQELLKQKKMNLVIDGVWGPESYSALFNFQKQNNLPTDGKLNKETILMLGLK